jgi:succinate dehydrogenase subunit C
MSSVKSYTRPMAGWWRKNPYFVRYMIREASAPLFYLYALWLLAGVVALARGRAAYDAWWTLATHPLAILLNLVLLVFAVYHTWTWFSVLPKTTPDIDVEPKVLIAAGIGAAVVLCAALFAFARWATR